MQPYDISERISRLAKRDLDSGAASSPEEAEARFNANCLHLSIGSEEAICPLNQAALLTATALGRRTFGGGVTVTIKRDAPLEVRLLSCKTLSKAVEFLGGTIGQANSEVPTVVIGGGPMQRRSGFCIRTAISGWRGGILPIESEEIPKGGPAMPLAAMMAAALAINEAFRFAGDAMPLAGRRPSGLSLWKPGPDTNWLQESAEEPCLKYLPSRLWLLGLGHLGQAFLWGLGLLPYELPSGVSLVLQDTDRIIPSNVGTSILTTNGAVGKMKTRVMADWAEARGFQATIVERRFGSDFRRQDSEPPVLLCGLDNANGRMQLEKVGFNLILEAGLGGGYQDFRSMNIHTFPSSRSAIQRWRHVRPKANDDVQGSYRHMLDSNRLDRCGVARLKDKAVAAPFVGAVASALVLSELLRLLHGGSMHELIDLDLLAIKHRTAVPNHKDLSGLNPGFTKSIM